jgi:hypothetical protein
MQQSEPIPTIYVCEYRDAECCDERPCKRCVIDMLKRADDRGDGPLVNALCEYGRRRWGPNLFW